MDIDDFIVSEAGWAELKFTFAKSVVTWPGVPHEKSRFGGLHYFWRNSSSVFRGSYLSLYIAIFSV